MTCRRFVRHAQLSDADDDDLGVFIVAFAAFSHLSHARQVEAARQEAAHAAEEERCQEAQRATVAAQEAEIAREREAKQRARALAQLSPSTRDSPPAAKFDD